MTSKATGAANAAPTLPELAKAIKVELAAIEQDTRSALQHAILAGEMLNDAKQQMEHGEWMPWLEKNFALTPQMGRTYMRLAANRKRVFHLGSIREALGVLAEEKPKKPKKPKKKPTPYGVATDEAVIQWVKAKENQGMNRDQIAEASKANGFPGPEKGIGGGTVSQIQAVLNDRKLNGRTTTKRKATAGGKRRRALYEQIRKEGESALLDLQVKVNTAIMALEGYVLPDHADLTEHGEEAISDMHIDLVKLSVWLQGHALPVTEAFLGDQAKRDTIKKCRERAEHPNTDDHERAACLLAIERLEVSLYGKKKLRAVN
jgi:hypothetical protein